MGPAGINNLHYLLQHVSSVIEKRSDSLLKQELGLGLSQYRILMVLEWNPRIDQQAIANALGQTEASVSRQIRLLVSKGLVETRKDNLNKRRHVTVPTTEGMKITETASNLLRRSFGPEFARLGKDSVGELSLMLQQLHKALCRPGKPGSCSHQLGL